MALPKLRRLWAIVFSRRIARRVLGRGGLFLKLDYFTARLVHSRRKPYYDGREYNEPSLYHCSWLIDLRLMDDKFSAIQIEPPEELNATRRDIVGDLITMIPWPPTPPVDPSLAAPPPP
jgi:hypothetical protein